MQLLGYHTYVSRTVTHKFALMCNQCSRMDYQKYAIVGTTNHRALKSHILHSFCVVSIVSQVHAKPIYVGLALHLDYSKQNVETHRQQFHKE